MLANRRRAPACNGRLAGGCRRRPSRQWRRVVAGAMMTVLGAMASVIVGLWLAVALWHVSQWLRPAPLLAPLPECGDHWVVRAGDTLWHVARTCYPHVDRRVVVDAIEAANLGADAGRLQPGQRLVLPGAQVAGR